jgi:protein TonB
MMTTLLESGARPYKSRGGIATAVVLHVVLITGAIVGTAHVVLPPVEKVEAHTVLYVAPPPPAPLPTPPPPLPKVHIAPRPQAAPKPAPRLVVKRAPPPKAPVLPTVPKVAVSLPSVDMKTAPVVTNVDVQPVAVAVAAPAATASSASAGDASDKADAEREESRKRGTGSSQANGSAFLGDQVEREVQRLPGGPVPRYPEHLRANNITGEVLMRFVVGTDGRVESGSFQVISSPERAFSDAVRAAVMSTRFRPAEVGGRPVRQLVEQSFIFKIDR